MMGRRIITPDDVEIVRATMMSKMGIVTLDKEQMKILEVDSYFTKILKYIPAEIVAGYVAINAIFKSIMDVSTVFQWIIVGLLTAMTALYIWRLTNEPQKKPAVSQIIISTIGFMVWVFAIGGPFTGMSWYQYYYGAILLVMYTFTVPVLISQKSA